MPGDLAQCGRLPTVEWQAHHGIRRGFPIQGGPYHEGNGRRAVHGGEDRLERGGGVGETAFAHEAGQRGELTEAVVTAHAFPIPRLGGVQAGAHERCRGDAGVDLVAREAEHVVGADLAVKNGPIQRGRINVVSAHAGQHVGAVKVRLQVVDGALQQVIEGVVTGRHQVMVDVVAPERARHLGGPRGDGGVVHGRRVAGVHIHRFVEQLPGEHGRRITPAGDDVAVFAAGEFAGGGGREKLGGRAQETAVGDVPWIFRPVGIHACAHLAVMLEHDLHAHAAGLGGGDQSVPVGGDRQVELAEGGRRGLFGNAPVEIQGAPVAHPHAGPIQTGGGKLGECARVKGVGITMGRPSEVDPKRIIGRLTRPEETRIACVQRNGGASHIGGVHLNLVTPDDCSGQSLRGCCGRLSNRAEAKGAGARRPQPHGPGPLAGVIGRGLDRPQRGVHADPDLAGKWIARNRLRGAESKLNRPGQKR